MTAGRSYGIRKDRPALAAAVSVGLARSDRTLRKILKAETISIIPRPTLSTEDGTIPQAYPRLLRLPQNPGS